MPGAAVPAMSTINAELITQHAFGLAARADHVRLAHEGPVPRERFTREDGFLNQYVVADEFEAGLSLVVNGVDAFVEPVAEACRSLEHLLRAAVRVNAYISPNETAALGTHFDSHDVLVFQLSGRKGWEFFEGGCEFATQETGFDPTQHEPGPSTGHLVLEPGDMLYVPRGQMHRTQAIGNSVHLTFGVYWFTMQDLIERVVAQTIRQVPSLRQTAPFGWDTATLHDLPTLADASWFAADKVAGALHQVQQAYLRALTLSARSLPRWGTDRPPSLTATTRFRGTRRALCVTETLHDSLHVHCRGQTVVIPTSVAQCGELITNGSREWTIEEFALTADLSVETTTHICLQLMNSRAIELVGEPGPSE